MPQKLFSTGPLGVGILLDLPQNLYKIKNKK